MSREIELECYSCSPDKKVPHEVLHARKKLVVRCTRCGVTRQSESTDRGLTVRLKVVVSAYDQSYVRQFEIGMGERLRVNDEIVVENGSIDAVRITAIELRNGAREVEAEAEKIAALWAQKIDQVVVKVAVHAGNITHSYKVPSDGEHQFVVGQQEQRGTITRIRVKQGAVLDRLGQSAKAKDIVRVYVERAARRPRRLSDRDRKPTLRR